MQYGFHREARGPSDWQLFFMGICFFMIGAAVVALLIVKSRGRLDVAVQVSAELTNVGDGLPAKSDVKFRGVLVGSVTDVTPARNGQPNVIHIELKPQYAADIPNTVSARVVPSNVFAVSSVQLVDNGKGSTPLREGSVIHEDQSMPAVLFQTTLTKFRQLLTAIGSEPAEGSYGVIETLSKATQGRGEQLTDAGRDLNEIVSQLNTIVAKDTGPSTVAALTNAADGLRISAPELYDALGSAVRPMQTLAEKRSALKNFLSAGLITTATMGDAFDHQTDKLINITTELTPVVGVLADNSSQFRPIFTRMQRLADRIYSEAWNPDTNLFTIKAIVGFTPTRTYVRADCPRYGEMAGPSCQTAPEVPVAPALTPSLGSVGFPLPQGVPENRPNQSPQRESVLAPESPDPDTSSFPDPSTGNPPPVGQGPPLPTGSPAPAQPQSAVIGGNVGPVGSRQELDQLSLITGGEANAPTQLLLGPLARGSTVYVTPDIGGRK
jgi:virulence factor Mce-like protein